MTALQRAAAFQLASALRDAMPRNAFDEERFLARLLHDGSNVDDRDVPGEGS